MITVFNPENLVAVIRRAASEVFDAKKPCDFVVGKVKSIAPLVVQCGGLDNIPGQVVSVCDEASGKLTEGCRVAMIRAMGGQRYLIVDTLSEGGREA